MLPKEASDAKGLSFVERYEHIFGWSMPSYQAEVVPYLEDDSLETFLLLAPPGHSKSTIICFLAADMLGRNPNERIIILTHTEGYSAQHLQYVVDIMSTTGFKSIYGDLIPTPHEATRWTTLEKFVRRSEWRSPHPSLRAMGIGSSIIGYRATRILVDDITTQANSMTMTQRSHLANRYFGSLTKRRDKGARIIVIGARFYKEDLYGRLLDLYTNKVYIATPENPLWPEMYDSARLEEERNSDYIQYMAQYEQDPIDLESGFLREIDLSYYLEPPARLHYFIACDLSHKPRHRSKRKSASDPFAMNIAGYDPLNKEAYMLDFIVTDAGNAQMKEMIKVQAAKWNPVVISIESDAAQDLFVQELIEETNLPVQGVTTQGIPKALRFAGMAVHFRNKKVKLRGIMGMDGRMSPDPSMNPFLKEWRGFGTPKSSDRCLDTAELNIRAIFRIGGIPATGTSAPKREALPLGAQHALFRRERKLSPIFKR